MSNTNTNPAAVPVAATVSNATPPVQPNTAPVVVVAPQKMMKIHFIQTLSTDRQVFLPDNHYELPVADALRYLEAGVARKSIEPVQATVVANPPFAGPLTADEKVGNAADTNKAEAAPVEPEADENADNPGALVTQKTVKTTVTPHGGTTTSNPSVKQSPPSDGPSPLATNTVSAKK